MEPRVRTKERHEEAPRERPLAPKKGKDANGKSRLSSVANAIRLIHAFSEDQYEIGISNLARRLGLGKSTVHRLASTRRLPARDRVDEHGGPAGQDAEDDRGCAGAS